MTELKKPRLFEEDHPASVFILEWWESLKQNKGDRAELRRCKNLEEIQKASAYQRCYWQLIKHFTTEQQVPSREQMSIIIGLASHIEDNDTKYIDINSKGGKGILFCLSNGSTKG